MAAKHDLDEILRSLAPTARPGRWVSVAFDEQPPFDLKLAVSIRERDGVSAVVAEEDAERLGLDHGPATAWIECAVDAPLSAVAVTSVLARELGNAAIPCRVLAGARYHHLFVPVDREDEALAVLEELSIESTMQRPAGAHVPRTDGIPEVTIRDGEIRLGQFLKLAGLVDSGAAVKPLLAYGRVKVNRDPESRRGRQLKVGDVVTVEGRSVAVG
jgi:ribosome-associated protein YbcJ (S4-like RNA binding protein)